MNKKELSRELARNFDTIMDAIHDDVLITDGHGVVIRVSPTFEELYGLSEDCALGKSVYELELEGYFKPSIVAKVLASGEKITMRQKIRDNRDVVATATPIMDANNKIKYVVSFSRDVTEMLELQKQYYRLENEIKKYKAEISKLRGANTRTYNIVGKSPEFINIMQTISRVADFDVNILLLGPSGVGKTTFAKIIHQSSSRSNEPFIDINCAAIPDNLLESELFGYEKGAFTGANSNGKIGLIELANGGTLLLDEISEMPLNLQAKLLKTIQDKVITRIGGTKQINVDFRLIAASNRDLAKFADEGKFRKDLFYRLNVVNINIPPLKDRREDILPLCDYILESINKKYGINKELSPKAKEALINYYWPGNVRELSNILERAAVTCVNENIRKEDLYFENYKQELDEIISMGAYDSLEEAIYLVEKRLICDAYQKLGSSIEVAKALKISQPTASRKIRKYSTDL
jgi:PAS domain S-box-containing protein